MYFLQAFHDMDIELLVRHDPAWLFPRCFCGLNVCYQSEILQRSEVALGFQTPCEDVFGPQKLPKRPSDQVYIWKTRVVLQ